MSMVNRGKTTDDIITGQRPAGEYFYQETLPSEVQRSMRYRVNVSISTKGQKTWDCTCDGEGFTMDEVLAESDKLVEALKQRYPVKVE